MKTIGILSFTKRGDNLRNKLKELLPYDVKIVEKKNQREFLNENFNNVDGWIFIGAVGIAIRYIAPLIKGKDVDPPVIQIDEFGQYIISLLSGHLGGANDLAREIGLLIDGTPIITTATDLNQKFAVDVWSKYTGCTIPDVSEIKKISSAILNDEKISIYSGFPFEGEMPEQLTLDKRELGICVSINPKLKPFKDTFNVIPKIVTLGVGCRKDTNPKAFEAFILNQLEENHVSILAIEQIGSIDLKEYEPCILEFSKKYNIPFKTATSEELNQVKGNFEGSDFVKSVTGTDSVCERSAVKFSNQGKIILSKQSQGGMTMALAMKDWKCKF